MTFIAKYNKVKAKLALISSSASAPKPQTVKKTKVSSLKTYEWMQERVYQIDNEMLVEVKGVRSVSLELCASALMTKKTTGESCSRARCRMCSTSSHCLRAGDNESSVIALFSFSTKELVVRNLLSGSTDYLINICRSKIYFKAENLKGVQNNDTIISSCTKVTQSSSASKVRLSSPSWIISLEREINPRNPQHAFKKCEACGSSTHTTTDHYDIEWFKRGKALQAKKAEALKSTRAESSNANRSKTPTRRVTCTNMRNNQVFRDDSTCVTEGYGSIKCNGIVFTKVSFVNGLKYNLISISQLCDAKYIVQFDEKRGTIFNSNKEIVMIAPGVRDVYVLNMTSSAQEFCFFAKASENRHWLWHKRLAHLNFKIINKLAKQNLVIGLPSLVYSKDKPCSSCEKGKHHRASFKTKQTSSIKKCLYLLYMDLFGPVTPRNSIIVNFCDEKRISQNFSSPYTPEQNGVVERKNKTLIEAARTMLSRSVFSKQYWTKAVSTACYTQNRSTIVKIHLKTPYEIFHKRIPNINFLYVFGCPVYIHNHKDHLGKFDEKADDGYLLGYSLVSKAFRVFNIRRQQTEETYHIIFNESPDAIKFSKPSVDNINIAKNKRYPLDEYLYPYDPSQRYQTNNNYVSFIEPYECLEPVVLETEVSSDQNCQTDQNDQSIQNDEILNDDHSEHFNHTNDEQSIDNLPNTKDI
ncbi:retrovirus-related pol polyprotein from transposon TNT 1-94 [Tanacetum coccineum]